MDLLIKYALQFVGTPYRWGGDDSIDGYDCSGFIQELLASIGMDPPHDQTAHGLYLHFKSQQTKYRLTGALACYGSKNKIVHIGMFIDGYRIIEAAGGNSNTNNLKEAARDNAYIRVRPFNHRKDLVAIVCPDYDRHQSQMASSSFQNFLV